MPRPRSPWCGSSPDAPGRYNFAHALIQHTLYEDMGADPPGPGPPAGGRSPGGALRGPPGHRVGELARHWISATQPIDLAKAIDYSRQAGDAALAALAPADALRYYAQALDLSRSWPTPIHARARPGHRARHGPAPDRGPRRSARPCSTRPAGPPTSATPTPGGRRPGQQPGLSSAAGVVDSEKVEVLELALDQLPADDPDRALVLATLCSELTFGSPLERRKALADEALDLAESSGDDATIVRVTNSVVLSLDSPSLLGESLARTADALARSERLGDPVLHFWAADLRAIAAGHAGDVAELDRCIGIAGGLARKLDQPTLNWEFQFLPTLRAMIDGDTDLVEQLATDGLTMGTDSGQPDAGGAVRGPTHDRALHEGDGQGPSPGHRAARRRQPGPARLRRLPGPGLRRGRTHRRSARPARAVGRGRLRPA